MGHDSLGFDPEVRGFQCYSVPAIPFHNKKRAHMAPLLVVSMRYAAAAGWGMPNKRLTCSRSVSRRIAVNNSTASG